MKNTAVAKDKRGAAKKQPSAPEWNRIFKVKWDKRKEVAKKVNSK